MWTVITQAGNTPRGGALWQSKCACGTVRDVLGQDLRKGKSVSCGCKNHKNLADLRRTHGASDTRLYNIWKCAKARCNDLSYQHYGGRGISVCAEWKNDFSAFREWALSHGYEDHLTIERVDVNGNYDPSNCIWAGADVQSANRRFVSRAPDGELWWHKARANGLTWAAYSWRISKGWPMELAVSWPLGKRRVARQRDADGKFI